MRHSMISRETKLFFIRRSRRFYFITLKTTRQLFHVEQFKTGAFRGQIRNLHIVLLPCFYYGPCP